jgi:hypothetical protein
MSQFLYRKENKGVASKRRTITPIIHTEFYGPSDKHLPFPMWDTLAMRSAILTEILRWYP